MLGHQTITHEMKYAFTFKMISGPLIITHQMATFFSIFVNYYNLGAI